MPPKFREWIISRWHAVLDYDRKPSRKFANVRAEREKARLVRLHEDTIKGRKKSHKRMAGILEAEAIAEEDRLNPKPPNTHICPACGSMGSPVKETRGSLLVEIALWIFFCFPGFIYSLWRLTSSARVCAQCGGDPIPVRTPKGAELWKSFHGKAQP